MRELSDIQSKILDYIRQFHDKHGYAPVVREIGEAVGIASKSHVLYHLRRLEKIGYLERQHGTPRAIKVITPEPESYGFTDDESILAYSAVPFIGTTSRFRLPEPSELTSIANFMYPVFVRKVLLPDEANCFAIGVYGSGHLLQSGLGDGDIVICRHPQSCEIPSGAPALLEDSLGDLTFGKLTPPDTVEYFLPYARRGTIHHPKVIAMVLLVLRAIRSTPAGDLCPP